MTPDWNPAIALLALAVALVGGVGALVHAPRLRLADAGQAQSWLLLASASLGLAVWLTQALALLALGNPALRFDAVALSGIFVATQIVGVVAFAFAANAAHRPRDANENQTLRLLAGIAGVSAALLFMQDLGVRAIAVVPAPTSPAGWLMLRFLIAVATAVILLFALRRADQSDHADSDALPSLYLGALIGLGIAASAFCSIAGLVFADTARAQSADFDTTTLALYTLAAALALVGIGLFASRVDLATFVQGRTALSGLVDANVKLENRARAIAERQQADLAHAQAELADEKRVAEATLDAMVEAVFRVNNLGRIRYANPAAVELSGLASYHLEGYPIDEAMRIQDERSAAPINALAHFALEGPCCVALRDLMLIRSDGARVSVEVRISPYFTDESGEGGKVYVIRDTTVERNSRRNLVWQAEHDALTGLLNRRAFEAAIKVLLNGGATQPAALAFLDLDRFKSVNDQLGHQAGDALLIAISQALRERLRERDQLARLGGDEFAILLKGCGEEEAVRVMQDLLGTVAKACAPYSHVDAKLGVSIGVTAVEPGLTLEALVHRADTACYDAKAAGRNQVARYRPAATRDSAA